MDAQLKKGLLEACVLKCLEKESSYGYKILEDLPKFLDMSVSTLYPILKRLQNSGYVSSHSVEQNGRLRKYYTITYSGRKKLIDYISEFEEITKVFNYLEDKK